MAARRSTRVRRPLKSPDATPAPAASAPEDIDGAWGDVIHGAARGDLPSDGPILALLLAAVTGTPGEGAEADPPGVAVLRAVRATVRGWGHAAGESARGAFVPFVEIDLLARRLDAAIGLMKRSAGGVQ
jgi:hypothetical protein